MKRTLIGLAVLALALSAPVGVAAGRGESVDPALMQPPLNPAFEPWECWRTGTGITCEAARTATPSVPTLVWSVTGGRSTRTKWTCEPSAATATRTGSL